MSWSLGKLDAVTRPDREREDGPWSPLLDPRFRQVLRGNVLMNVYMYTYVLQSKSGLFTQSTSLVLMGVCLEGDDGTDGDGDGCDEMVEI